MDVHSEKAVADIVSPEMAAAIPDMVRALEAIAAALNLLAAKNTAPKVDLTIDEARPSVTFKRLPNGEWGLRSDRAISPGQIVKVQMKNGAVEQAVVGALVSAPKQEYWLYTKDTGGIPPEPVGITANAAPSLLADWTY